MWLLAFYDLPTETKKQRDEASKFRKNLLKDGFRMFQFSIYIRHCMSWENKEVHRKRVLSFLPPEGYVGLLSITDKQFGDIEIFDGRTAKQHQAPPQQLELF